MSSSILAILLVLMVPALTSNIERLSTIVSPASLANESFAVFSQRHIRIPRIDSGSVYWILGDPCKPSNYDLGDVNLSKVFLSYQVLKREHASLRCQQEAARPFWVRTDQREADEVCPIKFAYYSN